MAASLLKTSNTLKPQQKHFLKVGYEGEFVTMEFGNVPITVHYQDALQIAALIMHKAKQCKSACGDISKHLIVHGELHDANKDKTKVHY